MRNLKLRGFKSMANIFQFNKEQNSEANAGPAWKPSLLTSESATEKHKVQTIRDQREHSHLRMMPAKTQLGIVCLRDASPGG